jgi:hypothetical protein
VGGKLDAIGGVPVVGCLGGDISSPLCGVEGGVTGWPTNFSTSPSKTS